MDKPMKGMPWTSDSKFPLRFPLLASPKLDGMRGTIDTDGSVISDNDKLVPNQFTQGLFSPWQSGLDGELIVGDPTVDGACRRTVSAMMRKQGEPDVTFYVFDVQTTRDYTFKDRLDKAKALVTDSRNPRIKVVQHFTIQNESELLRYEEVCLSKGYEGVMIRDPKGPYKHGRSTLKEGWLLKLKRFEDSEAIILGGVELKHNHNDRDEKGKRTSHAAGKVAGGVLGALNVRDLKTGVEFEIGSGFTREQRQQFWPDICNGRLVGKVITYKFFPIGVKDKPRHPVFKCFRNL